MRLNKIYNQLLNTLMFMLACSTETTENNNEDINNQPIATQINLY